MPLKLPLSCEVVQKRWFLGPRFVGGRGIPDFGYAFSNYTYFRPCGRFSLSSVQRPRRLGGEKKKETRVKYKSADIRYYVGRPKKPTVTGFRRFADLVRSTSYTVQWTTRQSLLSPCQSPGRNFPLLHFSSSSCHRRLWRSSRHESWMHLTLCKLTSVTRHYWHCHLAHCNWNGPSFQPTRLTASLPSCCCCIPVTDYITLCHLPTLLSSAHTSCTLAFSWTC